MTKKDKVAKNNEEKIYEIGYHLISSIAEENVAKEIEKIKEYLSKEKATIISEEDAVLRPLAYSIKKGFGGVYKTYDKAYFGFIKFELPEESQIEEINKKMKANDNVLRFLLIKTVRENTMYSPRINVFADKDTKIKTITKSEKDSIEAPATVEEMDKSIDALVGDEALKV